MKTKKLEKFEIGKYYKNREKSGRIYYIHPIREQFGELTGITLKEWKTEDYIIIGADFFQEPQKFLEISKLEFLEAKNRILTKLHQQLPTDIHQPTTK